MKTKLLIALGLVGACAAESDPPGDPATEHTTMDGYTGFDYDAAALPARLATGDRVRHGRAAALVPAPGEVVHAEALRMDGADTLSIEVDEDGTAHVTTDDAPATAVTGETAKALGPCEDDRYNLHVYKWTDTLEYTFQASSTPDYLPVAFAEDAIRSGGLNITTANNTCGRADRVGATIHYNGRAPRGVNIASDDTCGQRDGYSVVAFGRFDDGSRLGVTCTWTRKEYVPAAQATFYYAIESDIRLQKGNEWWWEDQECSELNLNRFVDLEEVVTHERGHSFGLMHVPNSPSLTMYPTMSYCQRSKRTLGLGDMLGLEVLY